MRRRRRLPPRDVEDLGTVHARPAHPPTPRAEPRTDPFRTHCPRCGTRFPTVFRGEWFETGLRCGECGVAVQSCSPPLAVSGDEVAYALSGLALMERVAVTADLIEARIPFRWEDGHVLVVPAAVEAHVDRLVDDVTTDAREPGTSGARP